RSPRRRARCRSPSYPRRRSLPPPARSGRSQRRPQQHLELGRADLLGRADEQAPLVERAADERGEVVLAVPELAEPPWRADVRDQTLEGRGEVVAAVEQPRGRRTALR